MEDNSDSSLKTNQSQFITQTTIHFIMCDKA